MLRITMSALLAASSFLSVASVDLAQAAVPAAQRQTCQMAFNQNMSAIEEMAKANNKAGIQALMRRAGCSDAGVQVSKAANVVSQEKRGLRPRIKVVCRFAFPPGVVICTVRIG